MSIPRNTSSRAASASRSSSAFPRASVAPARSAARPSGDSPSAAARDAGRKRARSFGKEGVPSSGSSRYPATCVSKSRGSSPVPAPASRR